MSTTSSSPNTQTLPSPLQAIISAFETLSTATAPSPRSASLSNSPYPREASSHRTTSRSCMQESEVFEHYDMMEPPVLTYDAPPSYDELFGPPASVTPKIPSRVDTLKTIARRVGKELTGGSRS
ncbi:hypothetical protein FRB99_003131 [Tulasnella sp. 403]|nr:hypothetical protein FRB99_003131 [Tulasnella sp. 403]